MALRWLEEDLIDPNDPYQCKRCGALLSRRGRYCSDCWKDPDLAHRRKRSLFQRRDPITNKREGNE